MTMKFVMNNDCAVEKIDDNDPGIIETMPTMDKLDDCDSSEVICDGSNDSSIENSTTTSEPATEATEATEATDAPSDNAIPILENKFLSKKHRLISVDSGFGSFGRCELLAAGSVDTLHTTAPAAKSLTTMNSGSDRTKNRPVMRSTGKERTDKKMEFKKVRPTTHSIAIEETVADAPIPAMHVNKSDGLAEVLCYFDENGSPKVREKYRKKPTLKQELKARSLGASTDDNSLRHLNKTTNCVSFTRFFKKFKESFGSKF